MNITGAFLHPKGGLRSPDPNLKIPLFHVVLVISSILLIVCAVLTALSIYLRVLQLARRRTRRRKSETTTQDEANARTTRKAENSASPSIQIKQPTARQPLEIKIEQF